MNLKKQQATWIKKMVMNGSREYERCGERQLITFYLLYFIGAEVLSRYELLTIFECKAIKNVYFIGLYFGKYCKMEKLHKFARNQEKIEYIGCNTIFDGQLGLCLNSGFQCSLYLTIKAMKRFFQLAVITCNRLLLPLTNTADLVNVGKQLAVHAHISNHLKQCYCLLYL